MEGKERGRKGWMKLSEMRRSEGEGEGVEDSSGVRGIGERKREKKGEEKGKGRRGKMEKRAG